MKSTLPKNYFPVVFEEIMQNNEIGFNFEYNIIIISIDEMI